LYQWSLIWFLICRLEEWIFLMLNEWQLLFVVNDLNDSKIETSVQFEKSSILALIFCDIHKLWTRANSNIQIWAISYFKTKSETKRRFWLSLTWFVSFLSFSLSGDLFFFSWVDRAFHGWSERIVSWFE
jgi:hypothetical protein